MIFGKYSEEYLTIRAAKNSGHTLLKGPPKTTSGGSVMKFDANTSQSLQKPHADPLECHEGDASATRYWKYHGPYNNGVS